MTTPRTALVAGARALVPIAVGIVPFALISGVAAVGVGLSAAHAIAMSLIIFAGTAQLVATQLIGTGAPALLIVATALIVNLRFLMYSASIAPHFRQLSARWKWLNAYLLTDQAYAVAITHFAQQPDWPHQHWFYLGAALMLWGTWQIGTIAGIILGAQIPASWQLDFTIPLTFITLLVPTIKSRPLVVAAVVAGAVATLGAVLPYKLGLIIGAALGIVAGALVEGRDRR